MKQSKKVRLSVAFHEAGHATMAVSLGVPFRSITIQADQDYVGLVQFYKHPRWTNEALECYSQRRTEEWLENQTLICLAGQIAHTIHAGRHLAHYRSSKDNEDAVECAIKYCGSGERATAWLSWMFIRARDLMEQKHVWRAVDALVKVLMVRQTLPGKEAEAIVSSAMFPGLYDENGKPIGPGGVAAPPRIQ